MSAAPVALREVSYAYDGTRVVDGATLELSAGRVCALLGPNASGKTTLLRLAGGLLHPLTGTVMLAGEDLRGLRRAAIARRIALVPQSAVLPGAFTALDLVLMGRTPYLGFLAHEGARDVAIALRALEQVGASELAPRAVGELSGGERQRILVARTLAQEAAVLLLDEPTLHLDPRHQFELLEMVRRLAREHGIAVLAVLHDLNLASSYADELVFLSHGRIVARGAPAATIDAELLRAVYGIGFALMPHPDSGLPVVLLPGPSGTSPAAGTP